VSERRAQDESDRILVGKIVGMVAADGSKCMAAVDAICGRIVTERASHAATLQRLERALKALATEGIYECPQHGLYLDGDKCRDCGAPPCEDCDCAERRALAALETPPEVP
jgi:hypothetical protein